MPENVKDIITRGTIYMPKVSLYIKRILLNGEYEDKWFDISDFFVEGGDIKRGFPDNLYFGYYKQEDVNIELDNSNRRFNDENDFNSFFKGFLSRHRTKFKIEVNLFDKDDNVVLLTTFYGLLLGNPIVSDEGTISFNLTSPLKMLENYAASGVSVSTPVNASEMVDRLMNYQISGENVVSRFFEGIEINPLLSTTPSITTPTIEEKDTILKKLNDYTLYSDFMYYVDDRGYFVWREKDAGIVSGSSLDNSIQWVFNGAGSNDSDYGVNVMSVTEYNDVDNFISKVVIDNGTENTAETVFTPGDGTDTDIYGERIFQYATVELDNTAALSIAQKIRDNLNFITKIWEMETVPVPQLLPASVVNINYTGLISVTNPFILGLSKLGGNEVLAGLLGSISIDNKNAKVLQNSFNLSNFKNIIKVREEI